MAKSPNEGTMCTREIVFVGIRGEYFVYPIKLGNEAKLIDLTTRGVDRLFRSDAAKVAITSDFVVARKVVRIVR